MDNITELSDLIYTGAKLVPVNLGISVKEIERK